MVPVVRLIASLFLIAVFQNQELALKNLSFSKNFNILFPFKNLDKCIYHSSVQTYTENYHLKEQNDENCMEWVNTNLKNFI